MATKNTAAAKSTTTEAKSTTTEASEPQFTRDSIDWVEFRKWFANSYLPSLSTKESKEFNALSVEDRRERSVEAYVEFMNTPKSAVVKRAAKISTDELVGILIGDETTGNVVSMSPLPPSTNKGPAKPGTPRGDALNDKRTEAALSGGRVVIMKFDKQA